MGSDQQQLELKKHVGAIHSSNPMTLVQRKIANGLLFNAYDDLRHKQEHQITIKALCQLIGYSSNDYDLIKKALVDLLSTVVEWNLVDKDVNQGATIWNASAIIADASIQGGICTYSYSNKMKQLLYMPAMYGRLNMKLQALFKSSYGLALYENCIRYQDLRQTPWFDYGLFRRLMGVGDSKYKIFRDFKRRVLDPAVAEVNRHGPITIDYELKRLRRQVVGIRFLISRRGLSQTGQVTVEQTPILKTLQAFGLTGPQQQQILRDQPLPYILEKIAVIKNSNSYRTGRIQNLAKYLLAALAEDYQPPQSSGKPELAPGDSGELPFDPIAYDRYRCVAVRQQVEALPAPTQEALLTAFSAFLPAGFLREALTAKGLADPLVVDQLVIFVEHHHRDIYQHILSPGAFAQRTQSTTATATA